MVNDFANNLCGIWACRDAVLEAVCLADLMREYGVELQATSSGRFTHKARCPLPFHAGNSADGKERTASFCVSANDDFYCFGCSKFGSVIDFVSLMEGIPPEDALVKLARKTGLLGEDGMVDEEKQIGRAHV